MKELLNKIKPFTDKIVKLYKKHSDIATPTAVLAIICRAECQGYNYTNNC